MAFDQHIEADHVGDDGIGLFSSIIARPILWLLGVDQDKAAEEKRKEERKQLERDILESSDVSKDDADNDGNGVDNERCEGGAESSFTCAPTNRDGDMDIVDKGGGGGDPHNNNRGSYKGGDSENQSNQIISSTLKSWPQAGAMGTSTSINNSHPTRRGNDCSHATQIVDDLVAVMENSTIDPTSKGPATSAMNSRCELSSSTNSLSASHSASAFPNQEISPKHPLHKAYSSNSIKWSDEHGSRPLVEYSDDHLETVESMHWTQLRRKKRRSSFDNVDENRSGTRRSQVRVIKSALRSGSYSPPVTMMCASGGVPPHSTSSTSSSSSSNQAASGGQLRSFHSLSMIGSSSGSSSADSMSVSANSSDSLAALTSAKLSMKDNVQCVPSTLQQGGGRANGGLIIPRGGPSGAYHLTMGTRASGEPQDQVAAKENQAEDGANGPTSNNNNLINGRMQAKAPSPHHHMFMPHPNGGVSPQYGFYVNITPPTPLHAAAVKRGSPLRPFEESSPQQQSFHGFSPVLPSPIPEVELAKEKGTAPTLAPFSGSVEAPTVKNRLKPTFPKNRVGMGMVLAGNHHHHAWPSIPMG